MTGGEGNIRRERKTLKVMVRMYCRWNHGSRGDPCDGCAELLNYALERIAACPYGVTKPVCSRCSIHCYRPAERDEIRKVMRFAGPRMLYTHPVLALAHLIAKKRNPTGPD